MAYMHSPNFVKFSSLSIDEHLLYPTILWLKIWKIRCLILIIWRDLTTKLVTYLKIQVQKCVFNLYYLARQHPTNTAAVDLDHRSWNRSSGATIWDSIHDSAARPGLGQRHRGRAAWQVWRSIRLSTRSLEQLHVHLRVSIQICVLHIRLW